MSKKVLFICRGNVGRSQMAEVIFNKMMDGKNVSTSAGTKVFNKEGESRDGRLLKETLGAENVILSLAQIGIDASDNKRTQLTPEILEDCDKAIVMAEPETVPDYLKNSDKTIYWDVQDPKGMDLEDTSKIRNQIELSIKNLNQAS
jgi:protein-tyrosine-phosphatase